MILQISNKSSSFFFKCGAYFQALPIFSRVASFLEVCLTFLCTGHFSKCCAFFFVLPSSSMYMSHLAKCVPFFKYEPLSLSYFSKCTHFSKCYLFVTHFSKWAHFVKFEPFVLSMIHFSKCDLIFEV